MEEQMTVYVYSWKFLTVVHFSPKNFQEYSFDVLTISVHPYRVIDDKS